MVKSKSIKLLFLIDRLPRGGKERRMIELLKGLLEQGGYSLVLVILSDHIQYKDIFRLGIPVQTIVRKTKWDLSLFTQLYRLCRIYQPDIIHSWGFMSTLCAIPAAKRIGARLINGSIANAPNKLTLRNKKFAWAKLSYPFVDAVVGNSRAGLDIFQTPPAKSHCIYNGFDFQRISELKVPEEVRHTFGIKSKQVVGMVAAFHERKDYPTFIRAAVRILEKGRNVTFLAIGDGPQRAACQAMVPAALKDRIRLTGLVRGVESLIQLFDVGVLATNARVHGEGISNAIMEMMALGKPVVATRGGGTPEIVVDRQTGFLTSPGDSEQMAAKIEYLLDQPTRAQRMGAAGRTRIETHFSIHSMTAQYQEVYQELLETNRKEHPVTNQL